MSLPEREAFSLAFPLGESKHWGIMSDQLSLEQWLGFNFSTLQLGIICLGLPALAVLAGLFLVRRFVPASHLRKHHDISGPIFNALGTVYGVFLTLIVTNTWHSYDQTSGNIVQEARCIESLRDCAVALPSGIGGKITPLLRQYRDEIVSKEWPLMARGRKSQEVTATLGKILAIYSQHSHGECDLCPFFAESVRILQQLQSLRASRIDDAQSGLLPFLWFVLLSGGALTVGFCFLFGADDFKTHAVMTLVLTLVISLGLMTIIVLDFPFTGAATIPPTEFQSLQL
jgi:Protein of unknown function (DUF4239)